MNFVSDTVSRWISSSKWFRCTSLCCMLIVIAVHQPLHAQLNANLAEDSAAIAAQAESYNYLLPIWGKKVMSRGIDIPYPVGVNFIGLYITQPIDVNNLQLSFGHDKPTAPFPIVQFGNSTSTVASANARLDLWILPFLNVYGLYGTAQSNTTVEVTAPVKFTSSVDQTGKYYGVGVTTAFGIWDHWASVDINWAWADLEKLTAPVRTRIVGLRFGHTFPLDDKEMTLAVWAGMMNAEIDTKTDGSVVVGEAVPQDVIDQLDSLYATYQSADWYQELPKWKQEAVDQVMTQLDSTKTDRRNTPLNYNIDKALAQPTNLLLGIQWQINKEWAIRSEFGLVGRWSASLNLVWRFRI